MPHFRSAGPRLLPIVRLGLVASALVLAVACGRDPLMAPGAEGAASSTSGQMPGSNSSGQGASTMGSGMDPVQPGAPPRMDEQPGNGPGTGGARPGRPMVVDGGMAVAPMPGTPPTAAPMPGTTPAQPPGEPMVPPPATPVQRDAAVAIPQPQPIPPGGMMQRPDGGAVQAMCVVPKCLEDLFAACPTNNVSCVQQRTNGSTNSCYANGVKTYAVDQGGQGGGQGGFGGSQTRVNKADGSVCYIIEISGGGRGMLPGVTYRNAAGAIVATVALGGTQLQATCPGSAAPPQNVNQQCLGIQIGGGRGSCTQGMCM